VKDVKVTGLAVRDKFQELALVVQKLKKISVNVLNLGFGLLGKENIEIIDI